MKNLRGYLTALVCGVITAILVYLGKNYSDVIDMVYPYIMRSVQDGLAQWSGQIDYLLWQLFALVILAVALATLILDILLKRSIIRWFGWVLACASFILMLHTGIYGLNFHSGDLSDDLRLDIQDYTIQELAAATEYYRNQANAFAGNINRDGSGEPVFEDFTTLASRAGSGFHYLTYERFFPVFSGSNEPVKKLGWGDLFASMGVTGITFPLTGEAAVNPEIPAVALPFTVCREMAHRKCIAAERDADFAAFLACSFTANKQYQYSAYFMAYRYCYEALCNVGSVTAAQEAARIHQGVSPLLERDMESYDRFFSGRRNALASGLQESFRMNYLKINGISAGPNISGEISDLLVMWYIQEVVLPQNEIIEEAFDPYDESQVDLSGIVNARG